MKIPSGPPIPELDPQRLGSAGQAGPAEDAKAPARPGRVDTPEHEPGRRGDTVELSDRARELARLQAQIETVPEARHERVEALRRAVEDGTFRVDAEAVAQKLLDLLSTDGKV